MWCDIHFLYNIKINIDTEYRNQLQSFNPIDQTIQIIQSKSIWLPYLTMVAMINNKKSHNLMWRCAGDLIGYLFINNISKIILFIQVMQIFCVCCQRHWIYFNFLVWNCKWNYGIQRYLCIFSWNLFMVWNPSLSILFKSKYGQRIC